MNYSCYQSGYIVLGKLDADFGNWMWELKEIYSLLIKHLLCSRHCAIFSYNISSKAHCIPVSYRGSWDLDGLLHRSDSNTDIPDFMVFC